MLSQNRAWWHHEMGPLTVWQTAGGGSVLIVRAGLQHPTRVWTYTKWWWLVDPPSARKAFLIHLYNQINNEQKITRSRNWIPCIASGPKQFLYPEPILILRNSLATWCCIQVCLVWTFLMPPWQHMATSLEDCSLGRGKEQTFQGVLDSRVE